MQWGSRLTRLTSFIMRNAESALFTMSCFHWIWPELTWLSSTFWLIDNVACVSETQILLHELIEKKTERHVDWQFREKNKHATKMVKNCLRILLMEETEGMEAGSHTLWESSCSLISQANIPATSFIAWSLVRKFLFHHLGCPSSVGWSFSQLTEWPLAAQKFTWFKLKLNLVAASAQRRREQVLDAGFQGRDFRIRDFRDEITWRDCQFYLWLGPTNRAGFHWAGLIKPNKNHQHHL